MITKEIYKLLIPQDDKLLRNLLHHRIKLNADSVVSLTRTVIPKIVLLIIGFGTKFNFHTRQTDIPEEEVQSCISNIKDKINTYDTMYSFCNSLSHDLSPALNHDIATPTYAQEFLGELMRKTKRFLADNDHLIVTSADKGGKTVILEKSLYIQKMNEFINNNIMDHAYYKITSRSTMDIVKYMEDTHLEIRQIINPYLIRDRELNMKNWTFPIDFKPFVFSYLYGRIKIHNENHTMRPIISSLNSQANSLSIWLRTKLKTIADHLSKHRIKSSKDVYKELNGLAIDINDRIVSWDYDNMFTNIPFQETKRIVRKYYHLISETTSVPVDIFIRAISFLIEDSSYFLFEDEIYRQCKGLTMGNSLSQILAEIFTSETLNEALKNLPFEQPKYFAKFVDDLFAICKVEHITSLQEIITKSSGGLKLKVTNEDELRQVPYLDTTIGVDTENKIYFQWYQKPCSWKRILDFHSNHPMSMKVNIVKQFMMNALNVTSPTHWDHTINQASTTLKNSNYSKKFIKSLAISIRNEIGSISVTSEYGKVDSTVDIINLARNYKPRTAFVKRLRLNSIRFKRNKHFKHQRYKIETKRNPKNFFQRVKSNAKSQSSYVSCPLYPPLIRFLNDKLHENNMNDVKLAPRPILTNRKMIFSNTKCKKVETDYIFSSFELKCSNCDLSVKLRTNFMDVQRTCSHFINRQGSVLNEHSRSLPDHILGEPFNIKCFKNRRDLHLSCPYECIEISQIEITDLKLMK